MNTHLSRSLHIWVLLVWFCCQNVYLLTQAALAEVGVRFIYGTLTRIARGITVIWKACAFTKHHLHNSWCCDCCQMCGLMSHTPRHCISAVTFWFQKKYFHPIKWFQALEAEVGALAHGHATSESENARTYMYLAMSWCMYCRHFPHP